MALPDHLQKRTSRSFGEFCWYIDKYINFIINLFDFQKGSYGVGDDAPSSLARYTPPLVASRYSESPVSDFEDGYSLYRDCLEQVWSS